MGEKCKRIDRYFKSETTQFHGGREHPGFTTGAGAVLIYQASSYAFDNCNHAAVRFNFSDPGNIYNHLINPTLNVLEQRMAQLEGGAAALAMASGAAALSCIFQNLTQAGDHIVPSGHTCGGTYNYLARTFPEYEAGATFVDPSDSEVVGVAIRDSTKTAFIEALGNPNPNIIDIEKITFIAHWHQISLVINSAFTTPYLIRPIGYGAGVVVHSATKSIDGYGITVGGVIVDGGKFDWATSGKFPGLTELNASYHGIRSAQDVGVAVFVTRIGATLLRGAGAIPSFLHGFLLLQGLGTLSLRMECHVENMLKVVECLEAHPQVEKVHYSSANQDSVQQQPYKKHFLRGGGLIFTFKIRGGAEKAREFTDNLEPFSLLINMADVKSLATHPTSATHSQMDEKEFLEQGIRPGTIRLSTGTEHIDDMLEDLEEALQSVLQM